MKQNVVLSMTDFKINGDAAMVVYCKNIYGVYYREREK
jgi:hypothetical protein